MQGFSYGYDAVTMQKLSADGMRVSKGNGNAGPSFAYDGQMGIEDVDSGSAAAVTDYAIGARSIERLAKTSGGTTNVCYPIFDGHGNMVSTLTYSGANFSLSNQRAYDAWGSIRNANTTGDPKGRYCAGLGHKQDDESSLIYMRARYYDSVAGRFVSEDSAKEGMNWLAYCHNDPVDLIDRSGCGPNWKTLFSLVGLTIGLAWINTAALEAMEATNAAELKDAILQGTNAVGITSLALTTSSWDNDIYQAVMGAVGFLSTYIIASLTVAASNKCIDQIGANAVYLLTAYTLTIDAFLVAAMVGD